MKVYILLLIAGLMCLSSCGNRIRDSFLATPEPKDFTITTDASLSHTGSGIIMDKDVIL